jgi:hypothetical protein
MLIFCRVLNLEREFQFLSTLMKFHYDAIPLMSQVLREGKRRKSTTPSLKVIPWKLAIKNLVSRLVSWIPPLTLFVICRPSIIPYFVPPSPALTTEFAQSVGETRGVLILQSTIITLVRHNKRQVNQFFTGNTGSNSRDFTSVLAEFQNS